MLIVKKIFEIRKKKLYFISLNYFNYNNCQWKTKSILNYIVCQIQKCKFKCMDFKKEFELFV